MVAGTARMPGALEECGAPMPITSFAASIADRIRAEHAVLAARWFERLRDLLPVDATEIFPTESLLDHIPALIIDVSGYLRAPEEGAIAANTLVVEKARELGTLRHHQHASLHQLLREYQLLGGVLIAFVQEEIIKSSLAPSPGECVAVVSRLHQSVDVLMQETVETFVRLYTVMISDQAERLEQFTRMATHEWRQPLGSLQFAVTFLQQAALDPARVNRTLELMDRNVAHLVEMTNKLERLARIREGGDDLVVQEVSVTAVAQQAVRQLREMAEAKGVHVHVADDLPVLTVDVGRLELTFVNLLSNAIKYSDPRKADRMVEVVAGPQSDGECQLIVRDNGIGIPADRIGSIFDRFSRAHADRDDSSGVTGVGLGLSIVADCVRVMRGRVEVESREGLGTAFLITLPRTPAGERLGSEISTV
jgi:signal transduction histidine kinase